MHINIIYLVIYSEGDDIIRKKIIKKKYLVIIAISVIILFTLVADLVFAGIQDFEPMHFNENNQLSFEIIDNAATNTAYKTLGWIIKKYDLPINDPNNISVTCVLNEESYVGDDGKAHTFFYVNREEILHKISDVSSEWGAELRNVGGITYLDSVMTIYENGELLGELYEDGSYSGEVYTTYDGISNARYWRSPTDLRQHYDRMVIINADPDEYNPKDEVKQVENFVSRFNYSGDTPNVRKECSLTNKDYNVQDAIPSTEKVDANGSFSKYAYKLNYQKISGTRTYGIKVNVRATLNWIDIEGNKQVEDVYYSKWYYIERKYCYYKVVNFELYQLSQWDVHNNVIGDYSKYCNNKLYVYDDRNSFIEDAVYDKEVTISGQTIYGKNNYRPTLPIDDYTKFIDIDVGRIHYDSDYIFVDDELVIGNMGAEFPSENKNVELTMNDIQINKTSKNGTNISTSQCIYKDYYNDNKKYTFSTGINNIVIHTPVICTSSINNNETENKIEIGKLFQVDIQNTGQHTNRKGYGWQNYSRYVDRNQVKFPFDVKKDGKLIKKESWIEVTGLSRNNIFSFADYITLGTYEIEFRTLALNYDESRIDYKNIYSNELFVNYSAYSYQTVNVIGPTGKRDIKNYAIVGTH